MKPEANGVVVYKITCAVGTRSGLETLPSTHTNDMNTSRYITSSTCDVDADAPGSGARYRKLCARSKPSCTTCEINIAR